MNTPRPTFLRAIVTVCLSAGLMLAVAACDDAFIDPFDNNERYYTLYGYLDAIETEHAVRVIPVTRFPERITSPTDDQATIDAVVTSTDLRTGQRITWRHTLEKLDDGAYGHIFRASFIVRPSNTYRLEVKRSDGKTATAETTVPYFPEAARFEFDPLEITPDSVVTQEWYLKGVASPWNIEAVYLFGNAYLPPGGISHRFYVPHGRPGERIDDDTWRFKLSISEDQINVREQLAYFRSIGVFDSSAVYIRTVGIRVRMLDANWDPPEGVFDPEVLAQPGTLSNVENGYGFWGSIGLYVQEWPTTLEFSMLLGYKGIGCGLCEI